MDRQTDIKKLIPKRPQNSHKGTFGHVLNIAGSGFYTGASYFSSLAPLKVGCGRSTLASTKGVLTSISSISPDIILFPLEETREGTISKRAAKQLESEIDKFNVVSIGCGLSVNRETIEFFDEFLTLLRKKSIPVVIDADGLNILSITEETQLPSKTILTPHPLELSRLFKVNVENILLQPEFWIQKCCDKYDCTTILKMPQTLIYDNDGKTYVNYTGNSALAHGGSGDVLCGMISGFLAQGVSLFDASVLSVHLHGITAEIASDELTEYSTLSSDLLNYIPKAIKTLL